MSCRSSISRGWALIVPVILTALLEPSLALRLVVCSAPDHLQVEQSMPEQHTESAPSSHGLSHGCKDCVDIPLASFLSSVVSSNPGPFFHHLQACAHAGQGKAPEAVLRQCASPAERQAFPHPLQLQSESIVLRP